jgi:uncharacterized membrane protein
MLIETSAAGARSWRYSDASEERDLRIDFIRGMVMLILIVVHIEMFSAYNFILWERIGVVSEEKASNTAGYTAALAALWLLVRHRVLFRWIPR